MSPKREDKMAKIYLHLYLDTKRLDVYIRHQVEIQLKKCMFEDNKEKKREAENVSKEKKHLKKP